MIVLILSLIAVVHGCEQDKIFACARQLQEEITASRFITDVDQLNSYCDRIALTHRCIQHKSQLCPSDLRATYMQAVQAEKVLTDELCKPGSSFQSDYLREAKCISSTFVDGGGSCRKSYTSLLASLAAAVAPQREAVAFSVLNNLCCAHYEVYECMRKQRRCGRRGKIDLFRHIFNGLDHNCQQFKTTCKQQTISKATVVANHQSHFVFICFLSLFIVFY